MTINIGKKAIIVIGAIAATGVVAVVAGGGYKELEPTAERSDAVTTPAYSTPAIPIEEPVEPVAYTPVPSDFKLVLKTLENQCYGSAGGLRTVRLVVSWVNPAQSPDPDIEYEVVYEVKGGEDGTETNSFTMRGDDITIDSRSTYSTKRCSDKLTAKVVDVLEN